MERSHRDFLDIDDVRLSTTLIYKSNNPNTTNGVAAACMLSRSTFILCNVQFLRRLDLSYNHIQRLENLNNLKLLWLDLSYNNISGFEHGPEGDLKTLLHLDYLNVNENNISSLKLFAGCSRFRELHARNNRFTPLLDMVVYMKQMRRLTILDLRTNPICSSPNYRHVVFNTFPAILKVDGEDVDAQTQTWGRTLPKCVRKRVLLSAAGYRCSGPSDRRGNAKMKREGECVLGGTASTHARRAHDSGRGGAVAGSRNDVHNKSRITVAAVLYRQQILLTKIASREYIMDMSPSMSTTSFQRLMRLLYIEQLTRARVSPFTPPADTNGHPIVVIVGSEAVGKGALVHRLATECSEHVERATLHTTAERHNSDGFLQVTRTHFDEMLLAGQFLTYSEIRGHSYGLSREEAYVRKGKIRVTSMDLTGALMLRDRGLRPYILLATITDRIALGRHQRERKETQELKQESSSNRNTRQLSSLHTCLCADAKIILKELLASATKEASKTVLKTDSLNETSLRLLGDRRASGNSKRQKSSKPMVEQRKRSNNSNAQNKDFAKASPPPLSCKSNHTSAFNIWTMDLSEMKSIKSVFKLIIIYLLEIDFPNSHFSILDLTAATESIKSAASTSPDVSENIDEISRPGPTAILDEDGPRAGPGADWSAPFVSKSVTFPPAGAAGAAGAGDEAGGSSQPDVAGMLIEPLPDDDYERNALITMSSNLIGYDRDNADSGENADSGDNDDYSDVWITFLEDYRRHLTSDVTSGRREDMYRGARARAAAVITPVARAYLPHAPHSPRRTRQANT
ncbi:Dynein regulatory complex subunit 3 [Eumeta japonica]|uniref:Dynein axonemal assembly factor 1 homolog n=1 Tax=Eumeta variegata TaxID=151549 RepID=A0A4C1TS40_EUMVA|nr:Dynein regulatory complex subunit 3 [Eumeta japonica]